MTELDIHLILEPDADPDKTATDLDAYLRGIEGVEPVLVEVEQPQLGLAEILAIIQLADTTIDLVQKLVGFLKTCRGKAKGIEIEMDGKRISIQDLTDDQRKRLTEILA